MGKQGPCCHCGISTTPLWRNGPSDKPVLCNACGSRWRTKGTLVNYMPMHLGGCGTKSESGELKLDRGKKGSYNSKEQRSHKRKEPCDGHAEFDYGFEKSDLYFFKGFEEDASTRSSTGSGISYSEGCVQRSGGVAKSFSVYWPLWDCPVPSKKRTPLYRHRLSQAKLAGMLSAMYDCGSSELVHPSEEDLLVEYKPSSMAAEIGLGGMFIRQSMLAEKEQESEASSLIFENKNYGHLDAFSHESPRLANSTVQFLEGSSKHVSVRGKENVKQVPKYVDAGRNSYDRSCILNKALLENFPYIKRDVLQSCQSPLVFVELKDIVNFDTFVGLLTDQEQLQLLKYVSSADFSTIPESLRSMFNSAQFESALANFQLLLSEGMFDSSDSGLNHRVLQHYENLFSLTDLTASGWMEQCSKIANRNKRRGPIEYVKAIKNKESLREKLKGSSVTEVAVPSALKTFGEYKNLPTSSIGHAMDGAGEDMEIVGFIRNYSHPVQALACPPIFSDVSFGGDWQACDKRSKDKGSSSRDTVGSEEGDKSGPCFSANSFYGSSQENGSIGQCETIEAFVEVGTDHDILLDFPPSMSFPQAELLQKPSWNKSYSTKVQAVDGDLKPADSGSLVASNTLLADDLDWAGLLWNPATTGSGSFLPNGTIFSPRKMFL